jgi:lysozyme
MSELISMITRHEGVRLHVYDDATGENILPGSLVKGHPTVGCGRALDVHGISRDEADFLLQNDVDEVRAALRREFYWYNLLNGPRQDAVASLAFNVGVQGFKGFAQTIAAIEAARYDQAAQHMLDSTWRQQVGQRAEEVAAIIKSGSYQV